MIVTKPDREYIVAETLGNAHTIVSAFDHIGPDTLAGFDLAACCAMVELESGGRMIWGADPWNEAAYPKGQALTPALHEHPVTQENYRAYKLARDCGLQPQGCGITQLTSPALQVAAEKAGGCWVPFYNARTGFEYLLRMFAGSLTPQAAFATYNGSGPAAQAYGWRAVALQDSWRTRLTAASG